MTLRGDLLSPWLTKLSPSYFSFWILILIRWVFFGTEKRYLTFIFICNHVSSWYIIAPHGSCSLNALFSRWHFYNISLNQFYAPLYKRVTLAVNEILSLYWGHINTIWIFIGASKLIGNKCNLPGLGKRWFFLSCMYEILLTGLQRDMGHLHVFFSSLHKAQIRARRNALLIGTICI